MAVLQSPNKILNQRYSKLTGWLDTKGRHLPFEEGHEETLKKYFPKLNLTNPQAVERGFTWLSVMKDFGGKIFLTAETLLEKLPLAKNFILKNNVENLPGFIQTQNAFGQLDNKVYFDGFDFVSEGKNKMNRKKLKQLIKEAINEVTSVVSLKRHIEDYVKYHPDTDIEDVIDGMEDEASNAGVSFKQLKVMAQAAMYAHGDYTENSEKYSIKETSNQNINLDVKKIKNIRIGGINRRDYPDFADAYVESAEYLDDSGNGRDLTEDELDWLNNNHPEITSEKAHEQFRNSYADREFDEKISEQNGEDDYEMHKFQKGISDFNKKNPQRYPCPTCKTPNALSAHEKKSGYQCSKCADSEEGVCEGKPYGSTLVSCCCHAPPVNGVNANHVGTCSKCETRGDFIQKTSIEDLPISPSAKQAFKHADMRGETEPESLDEMSVSHNISPEDKANGVTGYININAKCKGCGKPCKTLRKNAYNKECIACSKECANKGLDEAQSGGENPDTQNSNPPINSNGKVSVISVDQWTSSGEWKGTPFDKLELNLIQGGDSAAAKAIFGGSFKRKEVAPTDSPSIGSVWLVKGKDGFPKIWKTNYDTSD
jgi:hypothetical protein